GHHGGFGAQRGGHFDGIEVAHAVEPGDDSDRFQVQFCFVAHVHLGGGGVPLEAGVSGGEHAPFDGILEGFLGGEGSGIGGTRRGGGYLSTGRKQRGYKGEGDSYSQKTGTMHENASFSHLRGVLMDWMGRSAVLRWFARGPG